MANEHRITFRLPEILWEPFDRACRQDGRTPSEVLRQLVSEYPRLRRERVDQNAGLHETR